MWIGIDDTDSRIGGCTTFVALVLVKRLREKNIDIIGFPKLVRLNPNIPWKTRGNGAVSLEIGKGCGSKKRIGEFDGGKLFCYMDKKKDNFPTKDIIGMVREVVEQQSYLKDKNTNPGFVVLDNKPDFDLYQNAVKSIVSLDKILYLLNDLGGYYKGYKNKRGVIGATSSTAWIPKHDNTFEVIAYRHQDKWGTDRYVEDDSVKKMDKHTVSTFDNYDYENNRNRITPSSPCPILYGIRGEDEKELEKSMSMINSETKKGWMTFETNQGTDDHIQQKKIDEIVSFESVVTQGEVSKNPITYEGGHVFFQISDPTGSIDCAAYEPTKQFRHIIRRLHKGDTVEVYGGVRNEPLTINLEKIRLKKIVKKMEKVENPVCPECGKHMKSIGKNQGYKCKKCGIKSDNVVLKETKRDIKPGFYEVPICARRHLSKPLKRMKK